MCLVKSPLALNLHCLSHRPELLPGMAASHVQPLYRCLLCIDTLFVFASRVPADIFPEVSALDDSAGRTDEAVLLYNAVQQYAILGDEAAMCAEMAAFCKVSRQAFHSVLSSPSCIGVSKG